MRYHRDKVQIDRWMHGWMNDTDRYIYIYINI